MKNLVLVAFGIWMCTSCVPHKNITYFNDIAGSDSGSLQIPAATDPLLQPGDLVEIMISSISTEANLYFQKQGSEVDAKYGGNRYRISSRGNIDLPLIGSVEIAGLTSEAAAELIAGKLKEYLQQPVVNLRLVSFRITVLGEVKAPGVYEITDAEVNVLEAIGYAGDLTIYGKRENVLLIRNENGNKTYQRIDLNSTDFLTGDYFHLKNNDVLYVEPSKGVTSKDDNAYRILPLIISTLTFVVVIIGLSR